MIFPTVHPEYFFGIELTANSFTDLTSRFERGNWSLTLVDMFGAAKPGHGSFELANDDGLMTNRRTTTLVPGKAVKLTAYHRELQKIEIDFTKGSIIPLVGSSVCSFEYTRSNPGGTRINSAGLIEEVGSGEIRFDHSPTIPGYCRGYVSELSRVNYLMFGTDLRSFVRSAAVSLSTNVATGPDGTLSAARAFADGTSLSYIYANSVTTLPVSGDVWGRSVYAKAGTTDHLIFQFDQNGAYSTAQFHVASRTLTITGSNVVAKMEDGPLGFTRCMAAKLYEAGSGAANGAFLMYVGAYGVGSGDIYLSHAQLEDTNNTSVVSGEPSISSFIVTSGSVRTRQADTLKCTDISQFFNPFEGTMVVEIDGLPHNRAATDGLASFNIGANGQELLIYFTQGQSTKRLFGFATSSGAQASMNEPITGDDDGVHRAAFSYKENDFRLSVDGSPTETDNAGSLPYGLTNFHIGMRGSGGQADARIRKVIYYPKATEHDSVLESLSRGESKAADAYFGLRDLYYGKVQAMDTANTVEHAYRPNSYSGITDNFARTLEIDFSVSSTYQWLDLVRACATVSGALGGALMYVSSGGSITWNITRTDSSGTVVSSHGIAELNKRLLVHGTRDNSLMALYVNGTCVRTATIPASLELSNTGSAFGFQSPATYYGVKQWDRALSEDEIMARWRGERVTANLFQDLDFRDSYSSNSGARLRDVSGYGNDITLANSFSWTTVGSLFPLFYGRLTEISYSAALGKRTTLLEASDDWDRLRRLTYNTEIQLNYPVQSLFCDLMSLSNVKSFAADSSITDRIPFSWLKDKNAHNALEDITRIGNFQIVVDGNGTYTLRDRYWGLFSTAVASYSNEEYFDDRTFLSQDTIINRMKLSGDSRRLVTEVSTVAFLNEVLTIPGSSHTGFWMDFVDPIEQSENVPVASLVSLVSSQDYFASTNSDGTGTDRTSTLSVNFTPFAATCVVSIFNGHGDTIFLSRFQVRGYPIRKIAPVGVQYDVSSSQDTYGIKDMNLEAMPIADRTFLEGLARVVTAARKDGVEQTERTRINEFPDILGQVPGDNISVVNSFGYSSTNWRIKKVAHDLSLVNGLRHTTTYNMENFDSLPFFVLDHPTFGVLDSARVLGV
jgi:hypothetical protein